MKKFFISFLALGFMLLSMSACTPSGGGSKENAPGKPVYQGDLDQKVNEIFGKENESNFEKCELTWKGKAIEIATFLESHRAEIEAFYKSYVEQHGSEKYNLIPVGRFTFKEAKKKEIGTDTWTEYKMSWAEAYDWYLQIKDTKVDVNWVGLNQYVRGMIPDEEERVVYGSNYGISKDSEETVNTIYDKVKLCTDNANCTKPDLTTTEILFLSNGWAHRWYVVRLMYSTSGTFEERRRWLNKLLDLTSMDKSVFAFFPADIATVRGNTLEIPMDLTDLGDDGALFFIQHVESIWNIDGEYSIKIVPKKSPEPAYVVSVSDTIGERAYVSRREKKVQFYNFGALPALPHEFGHVLGFRDNYFTVWNSQTCEYREQANAGDIMSDHNSGQVLTRHWEQLKKAYWGK